MAILKTRGKLYNEVLLQLLRGEHRMHSDSLYMLLTTDKYKFDLAHRDLSQITNEVIGGGYLRQPISQIDLKLYNRSVSMHFADVRFSAAGDGYEAFRWVIFNNTSADKLLIASGHLSEIIKDGKPVGEIVRLTAGDRYIYQLTADGLFGIGERGDE